MGTAPTRAVSPEQSEFLSAKWHDRLSRLVSAGRKATALAFLERTIERSLPLFRADRAIFESRRTAWLIRTHLLLEWNRPAEALAWTCLESQLSASPDAKALRDRLLRQSSTLTLSRRTSHPSESRLRPNGQGLRACMSLSRSWSVI